MRNSRRQSAKPSTGTASRLGNKMTRRRFVGAATALAAPLVVPSAVLGRGGATPPSGRVTLGFIGTGGRGTSNMRAFLPLDAAQVVAVCDVRREKREQAAKIVAEHYAAGDRGSAKPCAAYNDFREVLQRDDVDAVVICPQDHWHGPIAVAAAQAGKDMYCEKPLGVAVTEGQAICDAVRRYERVFQTG
ncbi:MAG TPA: Gfo/Idh/MocA family oxidoreductase, partial [Thermoguttaceae bacterium]|nr:Gfo/Idh/MocA family oxidoreductase [Thermoguttaceae bacterium]